MAYDPQAAITAGIASKTPDELAAMSEGDIDTQAREIGYAVCQDEGSPFATTVSALRWSREAKYRWAEARSAARAVFGQSD